jgi:hypothetical protein
VYPMRMEAGTVRFWMRAAVVILVLLGCDVRALHAQRVEGQLRDAETGAPIAGATLQLLNEQGQAVHRAVSNSRGLFVLQARTPGLYRIHASRLGYRDATSRPVDLVSTGTLEVELRLSTSAVQLEPLTVTGIPRYQRLEESGFYERRDHFGPDGLKEAVFLEQHDIERLNPFSVADIFHHVRGVRTDRGGIQMRGGCSPAVVINGTVAQAGRSRMSWQSAIRPGGGREIASPRTLAGVEVYYGTAIPARYLLDAAGCGVIMYWTK